MLNIRVYGILLVGEVVKINNNSCTVYQYGNYYSRLIIIDVLIVKTSGLVF